MKLVHKLRYDWVSVIMIMGALLLLPLHELHHGVGELSKTSTIVWLDTG